jgi:hypothetical protein
MPRDDLASSVEYRSALRLAIGAEFIQGRATFGRVDLMHEDQRLLGFHGCVDLSETIRAEEICSG